MGVKLQAQTVDKDNTMQYIEVANKVINFHIFGQKETFKACGT